MSGDYFKPASLEEALRLRAERPEARFVAGGTSLFAGPEGGRRDMSYISLGTLLPRGVSRSGRSWTIGAGTSFQEILDAPAAPAALKTAAAGMATRNVRNRATLGGNIGADKSCGSLIPFLLAAQALLLCADGKERSLEDWRDLPASQASRLVLSLRLELPEGRGFACGKYSRTAADLAVLTCAVAGREIRGQEGARLAGLRIALGGLGPRAVRFPGLEAALEGGDPADKAAIEARTLPFFDPRDDLRGSAAFKRLRAAALLADLLSSLEAQP